jgi:hypothetical protein
VDGAGGDRHAHAARRDLDQPAPKFHSSGQQF